MSKFLTEPLLICELLLLIATVLVVRQPLPERARRFARAALAIVITFVALSVPVIAELLERSLHVPDDPIVAPDYIVVLGSGLEIGSNPNLDFLTADSTTRVLAGADLWKQNRAARVIVTGMRTSDERPHTLLSDLMAETAICHGVPPSMIIREPYARTTREHPTALLRIPGVTPASRIALVTSYSHMRRSLHEFHKYFPHIACHSVWQRPSRTSSWMRYMPDIEALSRSTDTVHEWLGIVYYRLTSRV